MTEKTPEGLKWESEGTVTYVWWLGSLKGLCFWWLGEPGESRMQWLEGA